MSLWSLPVNGTAFPRATPSRCPVKIRPNLFLSTTRRKPGPKKGIVNPSLKCIICNTREDGVPVFLPPGKLLYRDTADKWLEFLNLRPSSQWGNRNWAKIAVCTRHFEEDRFHPRQSENRRLYLKDGSYPTKNPPSSNENGLLSTFSLYKIPRDPLQSNSIDIPLFTSPCTSAEDIKDELTDPLQSNSIDIPLFTSPFTSAEEIKDELTVHEELPGVLRREPVLQQSDVTENTERRTLLLCHLCRAKDLLLIDIQKHSYLTNCHRITVVELLNMYLPIQIEDNEFPLRMCSNCLDTLGKWHELYTTCVTADRALRSTSQSHKDQSEMTIEPFDFVPVPSWSDPDDKENNEENNNANEERERLEFGTMQGIDNYSIPERKIHSSVSHVPNSETETGAAERDKQESGVLECVICETNNDIVNIKPNDKIVSDIISKSKKSFKKECKHCSKTFENLGTYRRHRTLCKNSSTVCDECGRIVPMRKMLNAHKKYYHVSDVICDRCGLRMSPHKLQEHMDISHSVLFPCLKCCCIFRNALKYHEHVRRHNQGKLKVNYTINPVYEDKDFYYKCPICKETFFEELALVQHLVERRTMKCAICNARGNCEKYLLSHKCKIYCCKFCSKSFYKRKHCDDHELLHTRKSSFTCQLCKSLFRTTEALDHHLESHV